MVGDENRARAYYELTSSNGSFEAAWTWLIMENMCVKLTGYYQSPNYTSSANAEAFYINLNKEYKPLKLGTDIRLNNVWS